MVGMAVPDKLLFPALGRVERGSEVPDLGSLQGGAERAERCVDIICFISDRTIIHSVDHFDFVPSRERHPDGVAGQLLHEHAEPGKEKFQESEPDLLSVSIGALVIDHGPEIPLVIGDRLAHRGECTLLMHEPEILVRPVQVAGDRFLEAFAVLRADVLQAVRKIPSHLLEVAGRVGQDDPGDCCPEFPPSYL